MDMEQLATIGLDIAKSVFQAHGIGKNGSVVVQRRLRRSQVLGFFSKLLPCVVGIEACASSHFWAREIGALGHDVRLMPAAYVKPYGPRHGQPGRLPRFGSSRFAGPDARLYACDGS
jgi:transposase